MTTTKIFVLYHPQLKFLTGNRANPWWSADFQDSRKFNRKCDATNCKVQSRNQFINAANVLELTVTVEGLPQATTKLPFTREELMNISNQC